MRNTGKGDDNYIFTNVGKGGIGFKGRFILKSKYTFCMCPLIYILYNCYYRYNYIFAFLYPIRLMTPHSLAPPTLLSFG